MKKIENTDTSKQITTPNIENSHLQRLKLHPKSDHFISNINAFTIISVPKQQIMPAQNNTIEPKLSSTNKRIVKQNIKNTDKSSAILDATKMQIEQNDFTNADLFEMQKLVWRLIASCLDDENIFIKEDYIYTSERIFKNICKIIKPAKIFCKADVALNKESTEDWPEIEKNKFNKFIQHRDQKKPIEIRNIINWPKPQDDAANHQSTKQSIKTRSKKADIESQKYQPISTASSSQVIDKSMLLFNNFLDSFFQQNLEDLDLNTLKEINKFIAFFKEKRFDQKWLEQLDTKNVKQNEAIIQVKKSADIYIAKFKEIKEYITNNYSALQETKKLMERFTQKEPITRTKNTSHLEAKTFLEIFSIYHILVDKNNSYQEFIIKDDVFKYKSNKPEEKFNLCAKNDIFADEDKNNYSFNIGINIPTTYNNLGYNQIIISQIKNYMESHQNLLASFLYEKITQSAIFVNQHLKIDFDVQVLKEILDKIDAPYDQDKAQGIVINLAKSLIKEQYHNNKYAENVTSHLLFLYKTGQKLQELKNEGEIYDLLVKKIANSTHHEIIQKFLYTNINPIDPAPQEENCNQNEISAIQSLIELLFNQHGQIKKLETKNNQHILTLQTDNLSSGNENYIVNICPNKTAKKSSKLHIDQEKFKNFAIDNSTLLTYLINWQILTSSETQLTKILQLLNNIETNFSPLFNKLNEESKILRALEPKFKGIVANDKGLPELCQECIKTFEIFKSTGVRKHIDKGGNITKKFQDITKAIEDVINETTENKTGSQILELINKLKQSEEEQSEAQQTESEEIESEEIELEDIESEQSQEQSELMSIVCGTGDTPSHKSNDSIDEQFRMYLIGED